MTPRVVIAGGGVAGLEAALALREHAGPRLDVELIAPEDRFVYRPLAVLEPFGLGRRWSHDLGRLLEPLGVRRRRDRLAAVDPDAREVRTAGGARVPYDALLVALGSRAVEGLPGAITFAGERGIAELAALMEDVTARRVRRVAFALPPGEAWGLPLYELALLTRFAAARASSWPELLVVTPEDAPLGVFGARAGETIGKLLDERDIEFRTGYPYRFALGVLSLVPDGALAADRAVALPAHRGPALAGLPSDDLGFLRVDLLGAVDGVERVWAAGDATDFPLKQGGLAAQQADAAASAIAAELGAPVKPRPLRPTLRGVLVGADRPRHIRGDLAGGRGHAVPPRVEPLWWPPAKVAGLRLASYLAGFGAPRTLPGFELDAAAHAPSSRAS